jgi:hypothetical protein
VSISDAMAALELYRHHEEARLRYCLHHAATAEERAAALAHADHFLTALALAADALMKAP